MVGSGKSGRGKKRAAEALTTQSARAPAFQSPPPPLPLHSDFNGLSLSSLNHNTFVPAGPPIPPPRLETRV